jgi:D-alanyl-D-alanine carboxypeptidase
MTYAMNMRLCRKILMTQSYTAPCVGADGKTFHYNLYHNLIVTQFGKITPNQPNAVKVAAGKTGFTDESRYCLVTYAEAPDGHGYVCVTAKCASYSECIADYLTIYNTYAKP